MWDDTPVGEVGIPSIQKQRGWETPKSIASRPRESTSCGCTPSRPARPAARHDDRPTPRSQWQDNVAFPYKYGGLAASEVTIVEVLSNAGYATAFYGKWHLGDIEQSYAPSRASMRPCGCRITRSMSTYTPQGQVATLSPAVLFPEMFPKDPDDMGSGLAPRGYVSPWKARRAVRCVSSAEHRMMKII